MFLLIGRRLTGADGGRQCTVSARLRTHRTLVDGPGRAISARSPNLPGSAEHDDSHVETRDTGSSRLDTSWPPSWSLARDTQEPTLSRPQVPCRPDVVVVPVPLV